MEHGIVERPRQSQTTGQTTGTIDEAVTAYLEEFQARVGNRSKRPQTHSASKQIIREFQSWCERIGKKSLSKINRPTCSITLAGPTSRADLLHPGVRVAVFVVM